MSREEYNYEEDIRIDETALDVEWLNQPSLMMKYARLAADARTEAEKAKERLEVEKAELDRAIRNDPDDYALDKITETVVQNTIIMQESYRDRYEELVDAQHESNLANYAVRSLEHRKEALENLVRLHGQQYFAGPRTPRNLEQETKAAREGKQRRADTAVSTRTRRTRRKG